MEKRIQSLILKLWCESVFGWVAVVVVFVLGELDVIENGTIAPNSHDEFVMNVISVLSTLLVLPLAMKLFLLNTTRSLRRMNHDEALSFYHVWSAVRLVLVVACIGFNIVAYFMTQNLTGLLCAAIGVCITVYCLPTKQKVVGYLEVVNNDLANQ